MLLKEKILSWLRKVGIMPEMLFYFRIIVEQYDGKNVRRLLLPFFIESDNEYRVHQSIIRVLHFINNSDDYNIIEYPFPSKPVQIFDRNVIDDIIIDDIQHHLKKGTKVLEFPLSIHKEITPFENLPITGNKLKKIKQASYDKMDGVEIPLEELHLINVCILTCNAMLDTKRTIGKNRAVSNTININAIELDKNTVSVFPSLHF